MQSGQWLCRHKGHNSSEGPEAWTRNWARQPTCRQRRGCIFAATGRPQGLEAHTALTLGCLRRRDRRKISARGGVWRWHRARHRQRRCLSARHQRPHEHVERAPRCLAAGSVGSEEMRTAKFARHRGRCLAGSAPGLADGQWRCRDLRALTSMTRLLTCEVGQSVIPSCCKACCACHVLRGS